MDFKIFTSFENPQFKEVRSQKMIQNNFNVASFKPTIVPAEQTELSSWKLRSPVYMRKTVT